MNKNTQISDRTKYMSGIDAALDVIGGKWKALILYSLVDGKMRYSEILRSRQDRETAKITPRMLTKELRELEKSGIILRTVYPEVPPRVEYSLTEKGESIMPILDQLCIWGCEHMADEIEKLCE